MPLRTLTLRAPTLALMIAPTLLAAVGCNSKAGAPATPPFDGVTGTLIDTFEPAPGKSTTQPEPESTYVSITALAPLTGKPKTYDGTLDSAGSLQIPNVPDGAYMLGFVSKAEAILPKTPNFFRGLETTERTLDLGVYNTYRTGLVPLTKPTFMVLDASLTLPWQTQTLDAMGNTTQPLDDSLQLVSRSTAAVAFYSANAAGKPIKAPLTGATSIAGWKNNVFQAGGYGPGGVSVYSKDDAVFLHNVAAAVTDPSQATNTTWASYYTQTTREVFDPGPVTLADGGSVTLSGAFKPVTQKTFSLDYSSAAWTKLFADAPTTDLSTAYLDFTLELEPGTPDPGVGVDATLFEVTVFPSATGTLSLPGDYTHKFSYGNPFDYGQELMVVTLAFPTTVTKLVPGSTFEQLFGFIQMQVPAAEASGAAVAPLIGLPRAVTVGGKKTPLTSVTTGVGSTPTVAFEAPTVGKPTFYSVTILELEPQPDLAGGNLNSVSVGSITTTNTQVTIPSGVLESGKHYYFQVRAETRTGWDPTKPFLYGPHDALAVTYTGVVTP